MESKRPFMVASEVSQKLPILIIDKRGKIGQALVEKLQEQFLVVVVTGRDLEIHDNLVHIPYRKKIPEIPDNKYSHMFVVYNGEEEILAIMPSVMKKANATGAKVLFITSLLQGSPQLFQRFSEHLYHGMQIAMYGEVFDNAALDANQLNVFIHQIRLYGRVEIPESGLRRFYPIFFDDVVGGIIAIAFAQHVHHKPHLIFSKHGFTGLTIARILQKIDPMIKPDFKKQSAAPLTYHIPEDGEYAFQNYPLEDKLRRLDLSAKKAESPLEKRRLVLPKRRKNRHYAACITSLILALLIVPPLVVYTCSAAGLGLISLSVKQGESGQLAAARQTAGAGKSFFTFAQTLSGSMFALALVDGKANQSLQQHIQSGEQISQTAVDCFGALALLQNIVNGKDASPRDDFLHALATIKNSLLVIEKMRAEGQLPDQVSVKLAQYKDILPLVENTIDSYPDLLGFTGKKTYLILFQNNMELRPGGGFIGSYATVSVDNGQISKPQVFDVYDADGKLTRHVEPPFQLRRYLGSSHWFLRDSNFDPDFVRDGQQASQFLQLETGQQADGVIAVDTDFLKALLAVTGPVIVPDYNETVTTDNFSLLTERHAENNFFPGSTQKKDFLRSLYNAILLQISEKKHLSFPLLVRKLGEALQEKHLLFAFSDEAAQKLFTVNGLSGSLWDGRVQEDNEFLDFFGLSEANLGMNKANYYLKREVEQYISLSDAGDATEEAKITYQNTSQKNSPFGGDYKNYLRFLLPPGAQLQSVSIDNQIIPTTPAISDPLVFTQKNFLPPQQLEVETTQEEGKVVIGFFVMVPAGTSKTVTITYGVHGAVNTGEPSFSYDLQVIKQPGTEDDPYSLFVTYPSSFTFIHQDGGLVDVGGKLAFEGSLDQDKELRATFSKK